MAYYSIAEFTTYVAKFLDSHIKSSLLKSELVQNYF